MPVVKRFGGYVVKIFFADHNPPHVHVVSADFQALVSISDAAIFRGEIPAKFRGEVLEWISLNREFLMTEWEKVR